MSKVTSITKVNPTFSDVRDWYEQNMGLDTIDLNDQEVYKHVYEDGHFPVIFQLTSKGCQNFFKKAKPKSIGDIAALTSIFRPGPLSAGVQNLWVKHENEPLDWGHPLINEVLKETRGCLVDDTEILTEDGLVRIDELVQGTSLPTYNENTHKIESDVVVAIVDNGYKEIIEIETEIGIIQLTDDHPILTQRGWINAGEISIEDKILGLEQYLSFRKGILEDE